MSCRDDSGLAAERYKVIINAPRKRTTSKLHEWYACESYMYCLYAHVCMDQVHTRTSRICCFCVACALEKQAPFGICADGHRGRASSAGSQHQPHHRHPPIWACCSGVLLRRFLELLGQCHPWATVYGGSRWKGEHTSVEWLCDRRLGPPVRTACLHQVT